MKTATEMGLGSIEAVAVAYDEQMAAECDWAEKTEQTTELNAWFGEHWQETAPPEPSNRQPDAVSECGGGSSAVYWYEIDDMYYGYPNTQPDGQAYIIPIEEETSKRVPAVKCEICDDTGHIKNGEAFTDCGYCDAKGKHWDERPPAVDLTQFDDLTDPYEDDSITMYDLATCPNIERRWLWAQELKVPDLIADLKATREERDLLKTLIRDERHRFSFADKDESDYQHGYIQALEDLDDKARALLRELTVKPYTRTDADRLQRMREEVEELHRAALDNVEIAHSSGMAISESAFCSIAAAYGNVLKIIDAEVSR